MVPPVPVPVPVLTEALQDVRVGEPDSVGDNLKPILSNPAIFGVNLYEAGLGEKVEQLVADMLIPGGVRKDLQAL